jgi:hypothetical protein
MRDKKRQATHVGIPEEASSDAGSIPAASTIANNSNHPPSRGMVLLVPGYPVKCGPRSTAFRILALWAQAVWSQGYNLPPMTVLHTLL